nr:MAG TPA: hypothetical protein [Caudoviricetes sp.]
MCFVYVLIRIHINSTNNIITSFTIVTFDHTLHLSSTKI